MRDKLSNMEANTVEAIAYLELSEQIKLDDRAYRAAVGATDDDTPTVDLLLRQRDKLDTALARVALLEKVALLARDLRFCRSIAVESELDQALLDAALSASGEE